MDPQVLAKTYHGQQAIVCASTFI